MHLTTNSGEQLTNGVDIWQTFRVYAKFALPDNQAHAGDTTVIRLPNEFTFGNSSAIELKDENGALVLIPSMRKPPQPAILKLLTLLSKSNMTAQWK
ncbi:Ig-like domain-containing protein [Streptococcus sanguinis]|uniref:Ig-like domain-containing protein n=1 Tax=Streptococcus sanguinis TaxID=1305 RepID=UPI00210A3741|nr:Ig-like domain-containing protein [Streptococcus sanguinis]